MTEMIYGKMIEAQRLFGVGGIEKKDRNKFQNFNYRSVDSTIAAASAIFTEVGIICVPSSFDRVWDVRDVDLNGKKRTDFTLRATYTFTFYAEDGSSVRVSSLPSANTNQDDAKLLGQTLSYAYKEALFKTFSIPVEGTEDVDSLDANRNQRIGGSEGYPLRDAPVETPKKPTSTSFSGPLPEGISPPGPPAASQRFISKRNEERNLDKGQNDDLPF